MSASSRTQRALLDVDGSAGIRTFGCSPVEDTPQASAETLRASPRHQDKQNIGIRIRMSRHLSSCLLVVTSGLTGGAQHAAMSGKVRLQSVCETTMVVLDAVELVLLETGTHSQHMKQRNTHCCTSGITSAIPKTAFILKAPFLAVKSWCTGYASSAPRESCTCTV